MLGHHIVHAAQGSAEVPLICGRQMLLAAHMEKGLLHGHVLAEIHQVVHPAVHQGVVLLLVPLQVHNVGVVGAAGSGDAAPQLQGDLGVVGHVVQQLREASQQFRLV